VARKLSVGIAWALAAVFGIVHVASKYDFDLGL